MIKNHELVQFVGEEILAGIYKWSLLKQGWARLNTNGASNDELLEGLRSDNDWLGGFFKGKC
jgi:hypothetical protein